MCARAPDVFTDTPLRNLWPAVYDGARRLRAVAVGSAVPLRARIGQRLGSDAAAYFFRCGSRSTWWWGVALVALAHLQAGRSLAGAQGVGIADQPRWVLPTGTVRQGRASEVWLLVPRAYTGPADSMLVTVEAVTPVAVWQRPPSASCASSPAARAGEATTIPLARRANGRSDVLLRLCVVSSDVGTVRLVAFLAAAVDSASAAKRLTSPGTSASVPQPAPLSARAVVISDTLVVSAGAPMSAFMAAVVTALATVTLTTLAFFGQEWWKRSLQRKDDAAKAVRDLQTLSVTRTEDRKDRVAELYKLYLGQVHGELIENHRKLSQLPEQLPGAAPVALPELSVVGTRVLKQHPELRTFLEGAGGDAGWAQIQHLYQLTGNYQTARAVLDAAQRERRAADAAAAAADVRRVVGALRGDYEEWLAQMPNSGTGSPT